MFFKLYSIYALTIYNQAIWGESVYHIFNRGIEKRKIFEDEQDYKIFMYYLFVYISPPEKVLSKYPKLPINLQSKNLNGRLDLIAYCLMPNHFHLLLKQTSKDATSKFMKQIINAYTKYFNTKYKRTGNLMAGRFRAALIKSDELLLHLSRYIHLNPIVAGLSKNLRDYSWSSYLNYINTDNNGLCKKQLILSQFPSPKDYEKFVNDQISYAKELNKIKHSIIE